MERSIGELIDLPLVEEDKNSYKCKLGDIEILIQIEDEFFSMESQRKIEVADKAEFISRITKINNNSPLGHYILKEEQESNTTVYKIAFKSSICIPDMRDLQRTLLLVKDKHMSSDLFNIL